MTTHWWREQAMQSWRRVTPVHHHQT